MEEVDPRAAGLREIIIVDDASEPPLALFARAAEFKARARVGGAARG